MELKPTGEFGSEASLTFGGDYSVGVRVVDGENRSAEKSFTYKINSGSAKLSESVAPAAPSAPVENPVPTPVFYQGLNKATSATCGETYTFKIENYSGERIWLTKYKNKKLESDYHYLVPATYNSVCNRDEGTYTYYAYEIDRHTRGKSFGFATFTVNGKSALGVTKSHTFYDWVLDFTSKIIKGSKNATR